MFCPSSSWFQYTQNGCKIHDYMSIQHRSPSFPLANPIPPHFWSQPQPTMAPEGCELCSPRLLSGWWVDISSQEPTRGKKPIPKLPSSALRSQPWKQRGKEMEGCPLLPVSATYCSMPFANEVWRVQVWGLYITKGTNSYSQMLLSNTWGHLAAL